MKKATVLRGVGIATMMIIMSLFMAVLTVAWALPEGESVVEGSATFDRSTANTLKITTPSDKAIIDYSSFSIGPGEYVYFYQPQATSSVLNRVLGQDPSNILGTLSANGIIYLINPNGIVIGPNANINAAGFIASTLNISNMDFLSGNYIFSKWVDKAGKSVINNGYIKIREGGKVALLGSAVANRGTIEVTLGAVVLAAGEKMTLNLDTAGMISVVIDEPVKEEIYDFGGKKLDSAVQNSGTILNPGGKVILAAKVLNHVFDYAINNSGIIQANSLVNRNGVIELVAEGAPVINTGKIEAGEIRLNIKDGDLINKGDITGKGLETVPYTGNIYIQAANVLQGGHIEADNLVDLKAEGVYQLVIPPVLGQGQTAIPPVAVIIQ
ncbi:MAG: filamentous hemagglutinin N-terminal domain-containing protein, partial [Candidatus Omnitrophica bacterium]|nr:filamentous hemagglutinin N-terminal domain-containing protein [Candidatus Omnitrophota bacterium]